MGTNVAQRLESVIDREQKTKLALRLAIHTYQSNTQSFIYQSKTIKYKDPTRRRGETTSDDMP